MILENEFSNVIGERFIEGTWDLLKFEVAGCENGTSNNILRGLKHCASNQMQKSQLSSSLKIIFPKKIFFKGLAKYNGLEGTPQFRKFNLIYCIQDGQIVQKMKPS